MHTGQVLVQDEGQRARTVQVTFAWLVAGPVKDEG